MTGPGDAFNWRIDAGLGPPRDLPRAPLSMTALEMARSCPLRLVFERTARGDARYVRRQAFLGRMGTAFHRSLDRLAQAGYTGAHATPDSLQTIRQVWEEEIAMQRQEAAASPRDAGRPEPEDRIAAGPAGILATLRLMPATHLPGPVPPLPPLGQRTQVPAPPQQYPVPLAHGWQTVTEHPVRSADGLLAGVIDRAERLGTGIRLTDVKSSNRPDVPDRYRRQLQLYAAMWNDTYPQKVTEAVLSYPLLGVQHPVSLKRRDVEATVSQSREIARRVTTPTEDPATLAQPGATCRVCCWRPWCRPFQEWTQADGDAVETQRRSAAGWVGTVQRRADQADTQVLKIAWGRGQTATLIVPPGLLRHLQGAGPGDRLLMLDTSLGGQVKHARAIATGESEVFFEHQVQQATERQPDQP